ncbi:putative membrane protein [Clostridium botulinum C str. Eklund]|nr:putative membrane protein [Clostridium botulinum C str. Eklund]KEH99396.1 membrane protein [Clostridium botulinum C/D str. BKT12695]NEZ48703.1 ABC transporter permease [Clostridium botulinum]
MDVFFQELKRQLNFKRFIKYILIVITLALLWTWFIVGGATADFMQTGCYKGYKGREAIKVAAKDRNITAGEMTEKKFDKGCKVLLNSLKGSNEEDIIVNKNLLQYSVYADKLIMQELKLRQSRGESIKNLLNIPKDAGRNFYKNEDGWYQSYIEKNARNESEKKLALSMWSSVKKPYTYYSGFEVWSDGISHIVFFSFILMIIVGVFAGSIIVQDNENGIDEIIKSTESGRKGLTVAKIVIPLIMASIIYLCGVGIYVVLLKLLLPIDALNTSIQVVGRSLLSCTLIELIRYVFVLGGIGVLVIGAFSTWLSSVVKKSSRAIQISTLTVVVGFLLFSVIDINSPIINVIKMLIPGEVVFADIGAVNFPITTFMGKAFFIPIISIMASGIIFVFSILFTALNYKRR